MCGVTPEPDPEDPNLSGSIASDIPTLVCVHTDQGDEFMWNSSSCQSCQPIEPARRRNFAYPPTGDDMMLHLQTDACFPTEVARREEESCWRPVDVMLLSTPILIDGVANVTTFLHRSNVEIKTVCITAVMRICSTYPSSVDESVLVAFTSGHMMTRHMMTKQIQRCQ